MAQLCYPEGEVIESKERPEGGAVETTRPEGSVQQPGPLEPPSGLTPGQAALGQKRTATTVTMPAPC
jgi:hypothetical protein